MSALAEKILEAADALEQSRIEELNDRNDLVAKYCCPREAWQDSTGEATGDASPVNGIGIRCVSQLAAGLYSNTVSLGKKWFGLRPIGEAEDEGAKEWLSTAAKKALELIASSNFAQQYYEALTCYVKYGTFVLYEIIEKGELVFTSYGLGGVSAAEDDKGQVDTVYRRFKFTTKQCVQKFNQEGDNLPSGITKKAQDPAGQTEKVEIIHAVYPRLDRENRKKDNLNMPWASVYVSVDDKQVIREGGYKTFPFQVPRFYKNTGEVFGYSVATDAVYDIVTTCRVEDTVATATEMAVNPPFFYPDGTEEYEWDLTPGGANPYDPSQGGDVKEYGSNRRIELGERYLQRKIEAVRRMFMVDTFVAMEGEANMTATEVNERVREKFDGVNPIASRLHSEGFERMIERVVGLMIDTGLVDPPPESLIDDTGESIEFEVDYTTRLTAMLKQAEISALVKTLQEVASVAEALSVSPETEATFDLMKIIRYIARANNVDEDVIRDERKAKETLDRIHQKLAEAKQAEQLADVAKSTDLQKRPEEGSPIQQAEMYAG